MNHLQSVADKIVKRLNPRTTIEFGCAFGFLVESLRDKGVDAKGADISEYAISQVRYDIKEFCCVRNILNTPDKQEHYDLAICIEVLEHLPVSECDAAIANLCALGDEILFSSTPDASSLDYTHLNVQQTAHWIESFYRNGYDLIPSADVTFVAPHALLFRRRGVLRVTIFSPGSEKEDEARILCQNACQLGISGQIVTVASLTPEPPVGITFPASVRYLPLGQDNVDLVDEIPYGQVLIGGFTSNASLLNGIPADRGRKFFLSPVDTFPCEGESSKLDSNNKTFMTEKVPLSSWLDGIIQLPGNKKFGLKIKGCGFAIEQTEQSQHDSRMAKLSVGILTIDLLCSACPYIRIESILSDLIGKGFIELQSICEVDIDKVKINYDIARNLDVLIVQRQFPAMVPYAQLIRELGNIRPKIVFEIDDALTMLPHNHIGYKSSRFIGPMIEEYIRKADLVTVSTPRLKSYFSNLNSNIAVLANCLDMTLWANARRPSEVSAPVKILFSGTITHESDLKIIESAIEKIILEFGDAVKFLFWGNTSAKLKLYPQVEEIHAFVPNYKEYAGRLTIADVDFAIIPLEDNPFNQAKSPIKWLEYSVCRIPGIYSKSEAYNTVVQDGKTGILVNNTIDEWYEAIKRFVNVPSYRNEIGCNAQAAVLLNHTVNLNSLNWLQSYRRLFPTVSIIIPVFNKCEYTQKCIEAVKKFPPAGYYEIIIIDNGSTDGTGGFLKSINDPLIKIITNPTSLGFATACNQGAKLASYDYLLFLNNETEPTFNWLRALTSILEKDYTVAAVGSKIINPNGTIKNAGVIIADDKSKANPLIPRHAFCGRPSDLPEANQLCTYQALTATCFLVRKQAFESVRGFDEGFWNGYEDIDFCFKLKKKNWKLIYQPGSVVFHRESQSGTESYLEANKNILRLHRKWIGKIQPDVVNHEDGSTSMTDESRIHVYATPIDEVSVLSRFPNGGHKNMVSIVILTLNQLNYTKECIESIEKNTPEIHEIIFIDNGSTDGTVKWLKNVLKNRSNYKLVENKTNLGFSRGCNQGILLSTGENLLLLNNDVVVTKNWLSGMLKCLNSAPDIGIVGPMTNNISGIQKVPVVDYKSIDEMELYAKKFRDRNLYRVISSGRIVGFCMLFKRKLAEEIGFLDENFGSGNFEDDDYCLRSSLSGYRNIIAGDVFVHHHGSRTFIGNKIDYCNILYGNRKKFREKWSGTSLVRHYNKNILLNNTISKADELYRKGKLDKAIQVLVESIVKSPNENEYFFFFVEILIDAKRYTDALEILNAMKPENIEAKKIVLMGQCQHCLGHNDMAEKYAEQALAMDPSMVQALNLKGIITYQNRDCYAADRFFQKAIELVPGFGESYTNLGVLRWESCLHNEAFDLFERGFILSPTSVDVATAYHSVVCELKKFSRAESVYREARTLYPYDKRIAFFMIDILIRQEKHNVAINEIEKAMNIFGVDEELLCAAIDIRRKIGYMQNDNKGANRNTVSLCMIVKNEEQYLAKSLMSVKPVVHEIIVVDTGSSDRTKDIAVAFGAKVFEFQWTNDFSEARNFCLSKASGDWILVLDADEIISPMDHDKLKKFIKIKTEKSVSYTMVTRNYTNQAGSRGWVANEGRYIHEEAGRGWVPSPKVRLFVNDKRINFVNPVHELVEPTLKKLGIKVKTIDIPVHHYGRLNQDKIIAKGKEYYRLGITKIEKNKGDYNAIKELAIQASEIGEFEKAVSIWQKILEINPNDAAALMNMGFAFLMMKQYDKANEHSKKAMDLDPDLREAALNYSAAELIAGDVKKAISTLESILKNNIDYPPAMGRLAAAYVIDGRKEEGLKYFDRLTTKGYDCSSMLEEQSRAFLSEGKIEQTVVLLQAAIEKGMANGSINTLHSECLKKINRDTRVSGQIDSDGILAIQQAGL